MENKFKKYVIILVVITLFTLIGCKKQEAENPQEEILADLSHYTIENKIGVSEEELNCYQKKIDEIFTYLSRVGFKVPDVTIVLNNYYKASPSKNQIVLDTATPSDMELLSLLMRYTYSDNVHYGLMYGFIHHIGQHVDLDLEEVEVMPLEMVESKWDYLFIDLVGFTVGVATPIERKLSKYVAVEVVGQIIEEDGYEHLYKLFDKTQFVENINLISDEIDKWVLGLDADFDTSRMKNLLVFDQNYSKGVMRASMRNIDLEFYMKGEDKGYPFTETVHEDLETLYTYMSLFDSEISRLEGVLDFNRDDVSRLTIKFYPYEHKFYSGLYQGGVEIIIFSFKSISHEYVHFIDKQMKRHLTPSMIKEMRAVYYSKEFAFKEQIQGDYYRDLILGFKEHHKDDVIDGVHIVKIAENYLGRRLGYKDLDRLYGELKIHVYLKQGNERIDLYDIPSFIESRDGYPTDYWISIMKFMERKYGAEEMDYIMLNGHRLDGSRLSIDTVIEDWYDYIENLSEEDYGNTYK